MHVKKKFLEIIRSTSLLLWKKIESKQEILFFAEITVGHFKPLWDQIHQVEQESSKKLENCFYPCGSQKIFWNNHPYKKIKKYQNKILIYDSILLFWPLEFLKKTIKNAKSCNL